MENIVAVDTVVSTEKCEYMSLGSKELYEVDNVGAMANTSFAHTMQMWPAGITALSKRHGKDLQECAVDG